MAGECCRIPSCSCEKYSQRYFAAIKRFPGNITMADKTLHNWRTEIPALFSFYIEDKEAGVTETSRMAKFLFEKQDLTQFLRLFLYSFQFPGGHMKPQDLRDIISHGIRFKPAREIVRVLMAGNKLLAEGGSDKEMSLSAEETTYCIFNDTRVTSGAISAEEVAKTVLDNRKRRLRYYNAKDQQSMSLKGVARTKGDMTRYAGDTLDYMVIANLLEVHNGYFYLRGNEKEALSVFRDDKSWFDGYESFYENGVPDTAALSKVEAAWFEYVNDSLNPDLFKTNISNIFGSANEIDVVFEDRLKEVVTSDSRTTKDIGNLGEAIICGHEKMRLKINGYADLIHMVRIVDSPAYHPGYDIDSLEADGTDSHRYIEVKTTISKQKIQMYGFHMSPNEWSVAGTVTTHYCVYRLMLSEQEKTLYILRDPVRLYKTDRIEAEPRDGMEVTFKATDFTPTEILTWKR